MRYLKFIIPAIVLIAIIGLLIFKQDDADADLLKWETRYVNPSPSRYELIKPLDEGIVAAKKGDKTKFLSLFSKHAIIEDPAGIKPYINGMPGYTLDIEKFFDTNLGVINADFKINEDIICGMDVMRDVDIKLKPDTDITIKLASYSLYNMILENGEIKINRLRAFWEIDGFSDQFLSYGLKGVTVSMKIIWQMLKNQGLDGVLGFMRGMSGIRDEGKIAVTTFTEIFNNRSNDKILSLFDKNNPVITFALNGKEYHPAIFIQEFGQNISLTVSDLRSAGWYTACRFNFTENKYKRHGIAVFQFNPESKKITEIKFYWN